MKRGSIELKCRLNAAAWGSLVLNRAAFHPWTGPRAPPILMETAIKCTLASPDIMLSSLLQRAQSSTTFIAPATLTPLH